MNRPKTDQSPNEQDISHSMAHYLLAIHRLKEDKGYARVTDIARLMNITKGSVSIALTNLKKRNFVQEEDESKFLFLTDDGHSEVHKILSSRTLLYYFFKDVLGVSDENAHRDSCMMEHLLGEESRERFFTYMKNHTVLEGAGKKTDCQIEIGLDLSSFSSAAEFEESQKGDTYL